MIWFEELVNRKRISKIFYVYEKTFPEEERRNKEQFLKLIENPDVYIDQVHVKEVLLNVISNAIEAVNEDGTGEIAISLFQHKKGVVFRVRDNGHEIEAKHIKRIGSPLYTSKKGGQHYGLGLFYVKRIVRMHNGKFRFKRSLNKYTTVDIQLPCMSKN